MTSSEESAGAGEDMGDLLDSYEPMKPHRRGDVVEGIVMRADTDGIFVNIGDKSEGIVPPAEMRTLEPEALQQLKVGDEIVTLVVRGESGDRGAVLSIDRAQGEKGWRVLEKALEVGSSLEGTVAGFNRGGAIVEVEGVQGFVPMSQLVTVGRSGGEDAGAAEGETGETGEEPVKDPRDEDIGKVLQLKLLEVNRGRNRAILSERQALQEQRDEQKARLIEELTEGEVRHGKVTGISSFGAFVDLGGADGLIHVSEFSWSPIRAPEDVVKIGEELDVYVLRVDAENKKIALSLRRLQPEPWETIEQRYKIGDLVDATVTKLTNFGAFARVEGVEGSVEGLIHISELSSRMIGHPREVVSEGEAVKVKVLRIEPERRRLGLSLKQGLEEEDEEY
jgi:small subunit ribosomal protein S1